MQYKLKSLYGVSIGDVVYSNIGNWYGNIVYIDERQLQVYTPSQKTKRVFLWRDLLGDRPLLQIIFNNK